MAFTRSFLALLRKLAIHKMRNPLEWAAEVFLPLAFISGIAVLFLYAFTNVDNPDTSYATDGRLVHPFSIIPYRVQLLSQRIAVVPASGTAEQLALCAAFVANMTAWHPALQVGSLGGGALGAALANLTIPGFRSFFKSPLTDLTIPGFADVLFTPAFNSVGALESYIKSTTYDTNWEADSRANPKIWGAIVINGAQNGVLDYTLRFNASNMPVTTSVVNTLERGFVARNIDAYWETSLPTGGPPFLANPGTDVTSQTFPGFLTLQREVDRWWIQYQGALNGAPPAPTQLNASAQVPIFANMIRRTVPPTAFADFLVAFKVVSRLSPANASAIANGISSFFMSESFPPHAVEVVPFPTPAYTSNTFYGLVLTILAFIFTIVMVIPNSRLVRGLVLEKETKMREGMKMMGLGDAALFGSHMAWYIVFYHLPSCLIFAAIISASFFPRTNYGFTFLLFFLFGTSSTSLMYFISTLFSKSKTASSVGVIAFIAAYFPSFALTAVTPFNVKRAAALLPPTAFSLGLSIIGAFENAATPASRAVLIDNFSLEAALGMMVLDTILYAVLGWYVDAVMPARFREFGVPRRLNFPCTLGYWREVFNLPPAKAANTRPSSGASCSCQRGCRTGPTQAELRVPAPPVDASYIEAPTPDLLAKQAAGRCVSVRGLVKTFDTPDGLKVAVDGADLDMYEGQIFVLLGQNGAGKSTTISMLTGLIEPTGGSMSFFGQDTSVSMASARRSLGVCPQHDVLWPDLTVKEHLETFAAIKGVPSSLVKKEVDKIIVEVGLTEKVNALSSALSGGMKRKLSVAIALIGGSSVVFLDEPTSGMDPYSRRSTWNILQNAREGRILLLTTHFMDEADILGDRIAIMSEGRVKCSGSPMFLKKRFGVGYLLTIVKSSSGGTYSSHGEAILKLLQKHVPEANVASNVSAELSIRLPLSASVAFPAMFEELDTSLERLGVSSYGISVTSISDVFLKIATGEAMNADGQIQDWAYRNSLLTGGEKENGGGGVIQKVSRSSSPVPPPATVIEMPAAVRSTGSETVTSSMLANAASTPLTPLKGASAIAAVRASARKEQTGVGVFFRHSYALFRKRLAYSSRDCKAITYQLVVPAILIAIGLGLLNSVSINSPTPLTFNSANLNAASYGPPLVPRFSYKAGFGGDRGSGGGVDSSAASTFLNSIPNKFATTGTNNALQLPSATATTFDTSPFVKSITNVTAPLLDYQRMSAFLLNTRSQYAASLYGAYLFTNGSFASNNIGCPSPSSPFFIKEICSAQPPSLTPSQDATSAPPTNALAPAGMPVTVAVFVNTTALHGAPTFINLFDSTLAAAANGGNGGINTTVQALPATRRQLALFGALLVFAASLVIIIAFAFVAASTSLYIVREREVSAKHQQLISGVSLLAYWSSNFLFDFLAYSIPAALAIILCRAFNISAFVDTDNQQLSALLLNFFLFGLASTVHTYLVSFLFTSPSSAQSTILFINVFAIILIAFSQFMSQISTTCNAELSLRYVFALLPSYCFGFNLLSLSFLPQLPIILATCDISSGRPVNRSPIGGLDTRATGAMLIYMFIQFIVYSILIIAIEYVISKPNWRQRISPDPVVEDAPVEEDADVVAEAQRVDAGGAVHDPIVISHLRKVYARGRKVAVRDLSFGVASGEVFGFLGINGAGKTTTLQILSGDVLPARGTAAMAGFDILSQQASVRRLLGYCPQFDSLLELLTVREHLELYSRIKGVPEAEVPTVVAAKIEELDLTKFANKTAGSLSGGNKRKLCVAIALIGDPPIVFLDEPSTGMDPLAKRFMWRVISRVASERKQCSIILTTHSMEEVEALCTRIGIMVGGRLRCLGSAQHLRTRHGSGFAVELRLAPPTLASIAAVEATTALALGTGSVAPPTITRAQLDIAAAALGNAPRAEQVSESGTGWALHSAFHRSDAGQIPTSLFSSWWAAEQGAKEITVHFSGDGSDGSSPAARGVFPGSALVERQGLLLRFSVPNTGESLASLFRKLEGARAATGLAFEASLGQTSLEAVFNHFAGQQEEEVGAVRGFSQNAAPSASSAR